MEWSLTAAAAVVGAGALVALLFVSKRLTSSTKFASNKELAAMLQNHGDVIVAETQLDLEEEGEVVGLAFADYEMYKWLLASLPSRVRATCLSYLINIGHIICFATGGLILVVKREDRVVGVARVCYVNPQNSALGSALRFARVVCKPLLLGTIPFLLDLARLFWETDGKVARQFLARLAAFDALDVNHSKVMGKEVHLHLMQIAVHPDFQNQGVGIKLLCALDGIARARQVAIYLETDTNALRDYYQRRGFEQACEYVIEDATQPFAPNYGMVKRL